MRFAVGVVALTATLGACSDPTAPPVLARSDTVEARALWVSRFEYGSAQSITAIMNDARRANFNIVYFQVRGVGDALYVSAVEPCSIRLCGKLGGTATWDPLAVAITEAHARGIELHAWINAFTGWTPTSATTCSALTESDPGNPRHVLLDHPEWRVVDNNGVTHPCPNTEESVWMSPG
ncbi:MAG: glycoside hydrolase family 10 protein, partial [Gemmatimonadaceae bacterium]